VSWKKGISCLLALGFLIVTTGPLTLLATQATPWEDFPPHHHLGMEVHPTPAFDLSSEGPGDESLDASEMEDRPATNGPGAVETE
jgi:hypothetical protein